MASIQSINGSKGTRAPQKLAILSLSLTATAYHRPRCWAAALPGLSERRGFRLFLFVPVPGAAELREGDVFGVRGLRRREKES